MHGLRASMRGWDRGTAIVVAATCVVIVAGLIMLGGQTSTILSSVGAPIGDAGHGGGGGDRPAGGGTAGAVPSAAPATENGEPGGAAEAAIALRDQSRLVYTGSLELLVEDVRGASDRARIVVASAGGFLAASSSALEDESEIVEFTFRIPSTAWDSTLAALRRLAVEVSAEETTAVEAAAQLVDLEARTRNLLASEAVLQRIAEQAGTTRDLLEVQAELTSVRGEIERLQAQHADLGDRVAFGTLATTFRLQAGPAPMPSAPQEAEWSAAAEVEAALAQLGGALQTVTAAGIWFGIVWLPFLLALALVARLAWAAGTRLRRSGGPIEASTSR